MPTTLEDIKEREKQLKRTGAKATQLAGVGSEFMSKVREELRRRAADKGVSELTKAAASTRKEFAAAPARIREEYKGIDPFRRMTLESERRGDIMRELTEIMDLKGKREAGVTDILEMGRAGIQAESERAQAQFGMQQKLYENVVGQWKSEQEVRLKEIDLSTQRESAEANRLYQQGMLNYYSGQLKLGESQLAESQRHAMAAELLDAESNRIREDLGYAGLASQEKVAAMRAANKSPAAPTYTRGDVSGLSPSTALSYDIKTKGAAKRQSEIEDAITYYKSQGLTAGEIVENMKNAGYEVPEFAHLLSGYEPPPSLFGQLRSLINPFD